MRLPTFFAAVIVIVAAQLNAASMRPNILFMMADDLNNSLGCYGHPLVKTPNLDKLAAKGLRYRYAFVTSPVFSVVRTTLITGFSQRRSAHRAWR